MKNYKQSYTKSLIEIPMNHDIIIDDENGCFLTELSPQIKLVVHQMGSFHSCFYKYQGDKQW